ncbi:E4 early protein [Bos taurus papillomavirus 30]|nr:E4 early protein [Bos taurus papillomavirus 30]
MTMMSGTRRKVKLTMMASIIQMQRAIVYIMSTLQMMQLCILKWDSGKCMLKTKFFLLLLPVRFLVGLDDGTGPKAGASPPDTRPASLPDPDPPHRIPETPGAGDRGRSRHRDPDHDHDRDRDRRRGRHDNRHYHRPGGHPEEDTEEDLDNEALEDRLRRLLTKWESDLERLREQLKADLLSL